MKEPKTEIRDAFVREQDRMGPLGETPRRLLRQGLASPSTPSPGLRFAGALAGLLLVVAVGVLWLSVLARNHSSAPARATPQPSAAASPRPTEPAIVVPPPTPTAATPTAALANAFTAPDSTPAILFADPANIDQVDGITWDGAVVGRIGFSADRHSGWSGNQLGTYYVSQASIFDRRGVIVAPGPLPNKLFQPSWSEDGRHFCYMSSTVDPPPAGGTPTTLNLGGVGLPSRAVAEVGMRFETAGVGVAACSLRNDRAIVVSPTRTWAIQISAGRVLWTRTPTDTGPAVHYFEASPDGRFVADNAVPCCPIGVAVGSATLIGPDGTVLALVPGWVHGFSWDGSLVVVATAVDEKGVQVLDRATLKLVWSAPTDLKWARTATDPTNGGHVAVGVSPTGAYAGSDGFQAAYDLHVIEASGKAYLLHGQVR